VPVPPAEALPPPPDIVAFVPPYRSLLNTLFALIDGTVEFKKKKDHRSYVYVNPMPAE